VKRRLVIDVKRLCRFEVERLRERLPRMLASLEDPSPKHPVDVFQTGPTTPIHADMRGFGLHLQVHPHKGDATQAVRDFCRRALDPTTLWADADAFAPIRSATQGAWEAVRAMVGDLIDANVAELGPMSAPVCDADACRGPRMDHVHPSVSRLAQSAVRHAFQDVPDVAWAYSMAERRRIRDFRIGDHSIAFSKVAMPDALTRLRVLAGWKDADRLSA
jgi:hypothetical protein